MSEGMSTGQIAGTSDGVMARLARRTALAGARRIKIGHLTVVLPDGSRETFGDASSELRAEMHIHDSAALQMLLTVRPAAER
jgi:hypothetical protein